jgi:hypothetical protein
MPSVVRPPEVAAQRYGTDANPSKDPAMRIVDLSMIVEESAPARVIALLDE